MGIELSQKHFPHYLNTRTCKSINLFCPTDKEKEKEIISITLKLFFLRSGKIKNQTKIVHLHEPLRPIQLKVRFVSLHLLETVKAESNRLKSERLIKKLENCKEDRFISPIVTICKKNKYQTPNKHELVDKVASQISNDSIGEVWFTNLDLKNAYSQLSLDNFTNSQCNLSLIGGDTTGTYQFLTSFYGLGDMTNEFQRVMDSTIVGNIPCTNCYLDDILVAFKASFSEHKNIVH